MHAGRELTAREIFLQIVETDPQNEIAWMWLTGLLDDLDDRIYACPKVLELNPGHIPARKYLDGLLGERQVILEQKKARAEELLSRARTFLEARKPSEALALARSLTKEYEGSLEAWGLIAKLTPEMDEQMQAIQKVLALNPQDVRAQQELRRMQYFQENLLDLAALYEEQGTFEKAIKVYQQAALKAKGSRQWADIYARIYRLEGLKDEKIVYISPNISIARLTIGPSLLYFFLMLLQVGINPLVEPKPLLWTGLLWTLLGGFLAALAAVRSRHRLWLVLFGEIGLGGTPKSRLMLGVSGWLLVLLPHILLVTDAFYRLFRINLPFP
jgi:tetratricopeptide (TPR) repeat protein